MRIYKVCHLKFLVKIHKDRERCFSSFHEHEIKKKKDGRVSYELRNRPRSPQSLCGSVAQHRSAESEGLRFDSSWELRSFSLSYTCDETKNTFLYFFTEIKLIISLILFTIQKYADYQNQPKSSTQSYTCNVLFYGTENIQDSLHSFSLVNIYRKKAIIGS